jgi:ribosomal RNA assembly protein
MREFLSLPEERVRILKKNKDIVKRIESLADAKVEVENCEVSFECENPFMSMRLKEVFRAFGRGFDIHDALDLLDEDYFFDSIEVKDYAGKSRKRQIALKGRVIGREGKMKKRIEELAKVKVAVYGKTVSIIGKWENLQIAKRAIEMLLSGASHGSVYRFLETRKSSESSY